MRATLRGPSKTASCARQAVQPPARRAQVCAKASHAHSRFRPLFTVKTLLLPAALLATSACASSSYMGISLIPALRTANFSRSLLAPAPATNRPS
ncbi:hypothetical protein OOT33_03685 [Sphingobium sp. DEHP117]|uniref:hypothetical protein n=1 Tax=Sphingobium sp. DEHP117 TaxID=2993436 RepID=UPI0027D66F3F|nr:hypothetical protein [Sphingobium sp. DEHP117]MDQ4419540.1 hypothetical protein [Sphingobium sp. DEHP117]